MSLEPRLRRGSRALGVPTVHVTNPRRDPIPQRLVGAYCSRVAVSSRVDSAIQISDHVGRLNESARGRRGEVDCVNDALNFSCSIARGRNSLEHPQVSPVVILAVNLVGDNNGQFAQVLCLLVDALQEVHKNNSVGMVGMGVTLVEIYDIDAANQNVHVVSGYSLQRVVVDADSGSRHSCQGRPVVGPLEKGVSVELGRVAHTRIRPRSLSDNGIESLCERLDLMIGAQYRGNPIPALVERLIQVREQHWPNLATSGFTGAFLTEPNLSWRAGYSK